MSVLATILIPTFQRNNLLKWNLSSLARQDLDKIELIVLDDSHDPDRDCESLADEFGCRYIHSGSSKPKELWRIPGFAINIGAQEANGRYIIICAAEMYHVNNTIATTIEHLNAKNVVIPQEVRDDRGSIIAKLNDGRPIVSSDVARLRMLDASLPFFMGISRKRFISIGGYDEDFTGVCWDDNDLVDRLITDGGKYVVTQAQIVHLFHNRHNYRSPEVMKRWNHNKQLYDKRKGTIIRNQGRQWGARS